LQELIDTGTERRKLQNSIPLFVRRLVMPVAESSPQRLFEVGGLTISVTSEDPALPVVPQGTASAFYTDPRPGFIPDSHLVFRRGPLDDSPERTLLFDSEAVWRLYRRAGGFLQIDCHTPLYGDSPYRRLDISADLSRGVITVAPHVDLPSDPLEYPLDELLASRLLAYRKGIEVHSCGLVTSDGEGLIFLGQSGAGKTTTARLWEELPGISILSDDRIIIRTMPGGFRMFGTPWHGEGRLFSTAGAPLAALFFLAHGSRTELIRLGRAAAAARIFTRCFPPLGDPEGTGLMLETAAAIATTVPAYQLEFLPDESAIRAVLTRPRV
jgi:hypothetical protein